MVRRLPRPCRSRGRRTCTFPTARRQRRREQLPCIGAILDTARSWIETGTASPARSSRYPIDARRRERWWRESLTRSMCVVRNVLALRTTHIGLESPMGSCLRHVMFAHIIRVEVVRCERMSTTCRREPAESSSPACHAFEQCPRRQGLHRRHLG